MLDAPSTASINTNSGVFAWRPAIAQSSTTQSVRIAVSDTGVPVMSATQSFLVTVTAPARPTLRAASLTNGLPALWIFGHAGLDYLIQTSSNLVSWSTIATSTPPEVPWWEDTNTVPGPVLYYRALLGP